MNGEGSRVYLDHNATSPLRREALRAMRDVLVRPAGNPSSLHLEGRQAREVVESAREKVCSLAGVSARGLVFTAGGCEAIAAAVRGVCDRASRYRRRIVVSAVEHSAVLEAARQMTRWGFGVDHVPCDSDGRVHADVFVDHLNDSVCLAALQWANNETGVVQPVERLSGPCSEAGVPLLIDAVQALGKLPMDAEGWGGDLLAMSAHKLGGPQGVGALWVRQGLELAPLIAGGAQERRRRGGTEAVAAIAGFGAAAQAAGERLDAETGRLLRLRTKIESRLRDIFPDVRIHGDGTPRLPNTVNFGIPGVPGESLVIALDVSGFALSTGSACSAGSVKPSHVLLAMGVGEQQARAAVRVSLGWSTSGAEVERLLTALPRHVEQVRLALGVSLDGPRHAG